MEARTTEDKSDIEQRLLNVMNPITKELPKLVDMFVLAKIDIKELSHGTLASCYDLYVATYVNNKSFSRKFNNISDFIARYKVSKQSFSDEIMNRLHKACNFLPHLQGCLSLRPRSKGHLINIVLHYCNSSDAIVAVRKRLLHIVTYIVENETNRFSRFTSDGQLVQPKRKGLSRETNATIVLDTAFEVNDLKKEEKVQEKEVQPKVEEVEDEEDVDEDEEEEEEPAYAIIAPLPVVAGAPASAPARRLRREDTLMHYLQQQEQQINGSALKRTLSSDSNSSDGWLKAPGAASIGPSLSPYIIENDVNSDVDDVSSWMMLYC